MGWMDEYEDGGQFDGLTNKGFNYNGAWGGPAQKGKKIKPLVVSSTKNPRYKAYKDSLDAYNVGNKVLMDVRRALEKQVGPGSNYSRFTTDYIKNPTKQPEFGSNTKGESNPKGYADEMIQFAKKHLSKNNWENEFAKAEAIRQLDKLKVKPYRTVNAAEIPTMFLYKKPQQPVIVEKPNVSSVSSLTQRSTTDNNLSLDSNIPIKAYSKASVPKYYNVIDKVNQALGGSESSYKYYPENGELQELAPEPYNTRTLTPVYQNGGSVPGSVGFSYARTKGIPSEGKYAKKTMPSAQDGKVIKDDRGQWAHPGEVTRINSGNITMKGVKEPLIGVSEQTGEKKFMHPGKNYNFANTKQVTEYPLDKWLDKIQ